MDVNDLRAQVTEKRRELEELEAALRRIEHHQHEELWFPQGFYTAYYVLSGLILGVVAAWIALGFNVLGALVVGEHPFELLRVYSTVLGGARSAESTDAVVLMFSLGIHTFTGAVCGAPIHVVYSRHFSGRGLASRIAAGVGLGLVMWIVNFYGVLSWLQPLIHDSQSSYIVDNVPPPVAALTHIAFTVILLVLQPLAIFNAKNYPEGSDGTPQSAAAKPEDAGAKPEDAGEE